MSSFFLEAVLPASGIFCVVGIKKPRVTQQFVLSYDEIETAARAICDAGGDAYFALASFADRSSREATSATHLRSVFVDLDCGPNKPYAETADAAKALHEFVSETGLPNPIVVNSGGGLHAYWPFTEDIPVASWLPVATAFKAFCLASGLHIDPSVTADAARILRVPGTLNHKFADPRPVQIVAVGDPTEFAEFALRLPVVQTGPDLSAARAFGTDATTRALATSDLAPCSFSKIIRKSVRGKGCNQISYAIRYAATLDEPLWRAALSIAWNCTDAETAIHKLSEGHPDYDPAETLAKAERLTGKPHTCEWYKANNPSMCEGCTHRITSPIQLGAEVPITPAVDGAYAVEAPLNPDTEEVQTTVGVEIPQYPYPYFRGANGGVFKEDRDEDGEKVHTEIYPQDLYITGRFFDSDEHGDGEGELVGINLHMPHDGIRRFHAPSVALLTKDKLRDTLVKYGVVAYGKQLDNIMAYIAASIRKLQSSAASSKTRSQMGWTHESTFVVGELEYTPTGVRLAPSASGTRQLAPLFHSKGSVESWTEVINFYNRPGMESHAFAFLVGLGSPLLQLLNSTQVRGAVLNLVSNGSGTGKTTVQMAINSVFGEPRQLLMEAKDTPASRYQRLGTLNSICMTVDELTNATGEQLSALVYGSTSGRAPHRMEAATNRLRNNHTTWCSVTVTSSNAVMADALAAHRSAVEGELKRVIDLPITVPAGVPKEETDALFATLASNYGVAGPVFIQHVVANLETVTNTLQEMQLKIDREAEFVRSDRFYSAVMAVAFTAGLIGNQLGLFKLDVPRIYKHALREVRAVKDSNGIIVGTPATLATETLAKFVNDNVGNTLVVNGLPSVIPAAPIVQPRGALRMRYEPDTDELVIPAAELRQYFVERRVDFKASIETFSSMGFLVEDDTATHTCSRRIAAGAVGAMRAPSTRCYVFRSKAAGITVSAPDAASAAA